MILPSIFHFAVCFLIAYTAGIMFKDKNKGALIGFLIALSAGFVKEVFDFLVNRWGMTTEDLFRDCFMDFDFDLIGAYVGGLVILFWRKNHNAD